ncbi:hypothetical protein ATKI12_8986 [Kitasatospora sp. Ki12]
MPGSATVTTGPKVDRIHDLGPEADGPLACADQRLVQSCRGPSPSGRPIARGA